MLTVAHDMNHTHAAGARPDSRWHVAPVHAPHPASCADGIPCSYGELRMLARKIAVREALGYGSSPAAKLCVLALAWGVTESAVAKTLSLTSGRGIGPRMLDRLPEPARTWVAETERALDAMSLAELASWVAARRPMRRVA